MPAITAVLHTENDALRLGRALETLYPCDHILIVDHGSSDAGVRVAHEYGARVVKVKHEASPREYLRSVVTAWIFCLDPRESLTESLAASLFEWKSLPGPPAPAFSVFLREETPAGWIDLPSPQTRLVPHSWDHWNGRLPADQPSALALEGELLRFALP